MSKDWFQFKKFNVQQGACAMKVSTDACLFGAWVNLKIIPKRILDIGTGTGLLALMMAQKYEQAEIVALEIDADAARQASENFAQSPWKARLKILQHNALLFEDLKQFDLIICNPPFFSRHLKGVSGSRNIARHNDLFPPDAALQMMKKYLTPHGEIQLLIPETEESNWMSALPSLGLKCIHVTRCRPKPDKAVNRLFLKIGHEAKLQTQDELCIYVSEKEYTSEVKALLTPFYLDSAWVKKGF